MLFADGRLFHRLDLSSGRDDVLHDCAPDQYRGRYRATWPRWLGIFLAHRRPAQTHAHRNPLCARRAIRISLVKPS